MNILLLWVPGWNSLHSLHEQKAWWSADFGFVLDGKNNKFSVVAVHMRPVHLKTGHFDEKIFITLKEALALIEVPTDKAESSNLCNILRVVFTFHLRHVGALGSKYCWNFGKLNHMIQKPS